MANDFFRIPWAKFLPPHRHNPRAPTRFSMLENNQPPTFRRVNTIFGKFHVPHTSHLNVDIGGAGAHMFLLRKQTGDLRQQRRSEPLTEYGPFTIWTPGKGIKSTARLLRIAQTTQIQHM